MKRKILLVVILIVLLCCYLMGFSTYGNNEKTIVNEPVSSVLVDRPRLEDDFYDYINYDYLKNDNLSDNEFATYATMQEEKIETEKENIIRELQTKNNSIGKNINYLYESYMNNTEEEAIQELNKYINKINNAQNKEEFIKFAIETNYELNTDILISPNILFNYKGESKKYFGLDLITYDWDNTISFYTISDYEDTIRMYKKYNVQLLKQYGYSSNEAIEIAENVQKMYEEVSRFSEINQNDLLENGYKIYSTEDLQQEITNIPLDVLLSYYSDLNTKNSEILVADINQLKQVNKYIQNENLDILKQYATLKILTKYSKYISENYYKIYYDYMCESQNYIEREEYTKEEICYEQIYYFFKDTVTEEFANRNFTSEQKDFYTSLIKEEINILKEKIQNKDWLSDETKEKAVAKMDKMRYTVGIPDKFVKVEENYNITPESSYMGNIINMEQNIKKEEMRQYLIDNITYNDSQFDQLTFNAFYLPNNNSINLLLGYIYSLTDSLNLGQVDLENNYYTILGSIGAVIGHELTHALDTMGCKYDEYGNYINWWNEKDEYNFNKLTSKVVKYYERYDQYGDTTLGENIADLGGVSIIIQIAENKSATVEDYKKIFESYTINWASQFTSIYEEFLLKEDVHSPDKNRANAVLSTLEKFYEVYDIKENDKMYVAPKDRVYVW